MKACYIIFIMLLLICGCSNRVQVVDVAGSPIKGAKVSAVTPSTNGNPVLTDSSGYASVPSSDSVQEVTHIQVECVGYTMTQVPVPSKYPLVITLRKP